MFNLETKRISIIFTRLEGRFGTLVYWLTDRRYTHASLRLNDMGEEYYSFNFKGMCVEKPKFFKSKRIMSSIVYQIDIPSDVYDQLQEQLLFHLERKSTYKYSSVGVALCLMRIPHHFDNEFFCSQFVAKLLSEAGVIEMKRPVSICHPTALERHLKRNRGLHSITESPHLLETC